MHRKVEGVNSSLRLPIYQKTGKARKIKNFALVIKLFDGMHFKHLDRKFILKKPGTILPCKSKTYLILKVVYFFKGIPTIIQTKKYSNVGERSILGLMKYTI